MPALTQINLIGGGFMGRSMYDGWRLSGWAEDKIAVTDPQPQLCMGTQPRDQKRSTDDAALWVIATKPQYMAAAIAENAPLMQPGDAVLSIAAGIRLADIGAQLPTGVSAFRAMPNLPVSLGKGTVSLTSYENNNSLTTELAAILSRLGKCIELPEENIDAFTAVAGSGPAYIFQFVEHLTEAAIENGIPAELAAQIVPQVLFGASALLENADVDAAELRRRVTSPGGTTAAGLAALNENGAFAALISACIKAAKARGAELAEPNT